MATSITVIMILIGPLWVFGEVGVQGKKENRRGFV